MGCISVCKGLSQLLDWMDKKLKKDHRGKTVCDWESQSATVKKGNASISWVGAEAPIKDAKGKGAPVVICQDDPTSVDAALKKNPDLPWHQLPWPMGAVVPPCLTEAREAWAKANPPKANPPKARP